MYPLRIPPYTRVLYELADPAGGSPRQADVILTPAGLWHHWPEAFEDRWSVMEIGPLVVALKVDGLVPTR